MSMKLRALASGLLALVLAAPSIFAAPSAAEIQPGQTLVVPQDGVQLKMGNEVIGRLNKGTAFLVTTIRGEWVGGYVEEHGKRRNGWILSKDFSASSASGRSAKNTARSPGPEPSLDRIVDECTDYVILEIMFRKDVKCFALEWFSTLDEPIELKIARSGDIAFLQDEDATSVELLEGRIKSAVAIFKGVAENYPQYPHDVVRNRAKKLADQEWVEILMKKFHEWEIDYHNVTDAKQAARLVELARMVKKTLDAGGLWEARRQMKEKIREEIVKRPDFVKSYKTVFAESDELRKARDRARQLMNDAGRVDGAKKGPGLINGIMGRQRGLGRQVRVG